MAPSMYFFTTLRSAFVKSRFYIKMSRQKEKWKQEHYDYAIVKIKSLNFVE